MRQFLALYAVTGLGMLAVFLTSPHVWRVTLPNNRLFILTFILMWAVFWPLWIYKAVRR